MATSAKQSAVDTLHRLYVAELTLRLQAGDAPAAVLTAIGNFLHRSGTKAANDSPAMKRLTASYEALPFLSDDALGPAGPATLPNHSASAPKDQL
jgi:hypothetical protein